MFAQHLNLVGYVSGPSGRRCSELTRLKDQFSLQIPLIIEEFLLELADCVLDYSFESLLKNGRKRVYSTFVIPPVGPIRDERAYQPSSIIGWIAFCRQRHLADNLLPLMLECKKNRWVFCDLGSEDLPMLIHKDDFDYGAGWTSISHSFEAFLAGLTPHIESIVRTVKVAGFERITDDGKAYYSALLGSDWENILRAELEKK